ncbi:hypothetical protein NL676_034157 [Syzygium grande]|nr:hypothetical protein NL676_034157 [Syzygium grande]
MVMVASRIGPGQPLPTLAILRSGRLTLGVKGPRQLPLRLSSPSREAQPHRFARRPLQGRRLSLQRIRANPARIGEVIGLAHLWGQEVGSPNERRRTTPHDNSGKVSMPRVRKANLASCQGWARLTFPIADKDNPSRFWRGRRY